MHFDINYFLYRRLSSIVTCKLRVPGGGIISLSDKYQVASFQDVFLDPNYWRLYSLVEEAPALVVDCGSHLGHFSILADICFRSRFQSNDTQYIMIEANSGLLPSLRRNIELANLSGRAKVIHGAIGERSGVATLSTNRKNLLTSSTLVKRGRQEQVPYVDLSEAVWEDRIDILKLDIEGAELTFAERNHDILEKTRLVMVEVHRDLVNHHKFDRIMHECSFVTSGPILESQGNLMLAYIKA